MSSPGSDSKDPAAFYKTFAITEADDGIRPAGPPDGCFYCQRKVGELHVKGCVITWRYRAVKLRATLVFIEEVPEHWTDEEIRFRYNESTWCASNIWDRFDGGCGCSALDGVEIIDHL